MSGVWLRVAARVLQGSDWWWSIRRAIRDSVARALDPLACSTTPDRAKHDDPRVTVLPVPEGMTIDDVLEEMSAFGQLLPYEGEPEWVVIECPGGTLCHCPSTALSCSYREYENGWLVVAHVRGLVVPIALLPLVERWDRMVGRHSRLDPYTVNRPMW